MRASKLLLGLGFLFAFASLTFAQNGTSISGPGIGFISDAEGRTLWPLLGILGASIPGDPLALPEAISHGRISPRHNYALATAAASGLPVIVQLSTPDLTIAPLAGGSPNSEWIAISPTGSAAALYGKDSRRLQLVSGLPAAPEIVSEFDTTLLGGDIRSVAISDDAKLALINSGNEIGTLWVVDGRGTTSPVSAIQPSQVTFVAGRHDALIADDATHEVFLLQNVDQNPVRLPGIVLRENAGAISAVAASTDAQTIFVAQEGSAEITITDLRTHATTVVSCPCKPTVIEPMQGNSVFRLNNLSNGPLTILDASSFPAVSPRTLMIPMDSKALRGGEGK